MGRLLSLAVIALLVAGGFSWWRLGGETAEQLQVALGEPRCQGTRVEAGGVAVVAPSMQCAYEVTVRNDSDEEVRLNALRGGDLDDDSSVVAADLPADEARIAQRIGPGDSLRRELVVVFRDGATSPAGPLRLEAPEVTGTLYVRPFGVTPSEPLVVRVPPDLADDA